MPSQLPLALRVREGLTLDSFVVGSNGPAVALLASLAAGEPGQLFLHGEPGSGRTHLLSAAVVAAEQAGRRACLLPAAELAPLPPALLEDFDSFDLVAVDDLQHVAGVRAWEEALFHLYNRLMAAGRVLICTADRPPTQCGVQLPDLSSRLAAGPVFALHGLSDDDLAALLQQRAAARGLRLGEGVASFIIHRGQRSPAALLATLNRLDEHALARQRRLTIPLVKEALGW